MKYKNVYYGMMTAARRELTVTFFKENGLPNAEHLNAVVLNAYEQPQREFHLFAIELLYKQKKHWSEKTIDLLEKLIVQHSWWDSVDFIAVKCVGHFALKFPETAKTKIDLWCNSSNMWLNRSSIIYQNSYKTKTNQQVLFKNIQKHNHRNEFFIRKAIGWALRSYADTNPKAVIDFCDSTPLKPLSLKEALRKIS
jgi:3-methyladenine DNA glycosylase AlkD